MVPSSTTTFQDTEWQRISYADAKRFVSEVLIKAGADDASTQAVADSLIGASLRGVDSHGLRLLPHYVAALTGGRINGFPKMTFTPRMLATGTLDADDGFGHYASYRAIEEAMKLADVAGVGAVSVINSSHFGAAGSYTLKAAEAGYIAMVFSNSDKLVLAHDGTAPFHGTNPISVAAPVIGEQPYLLDMATSSIPFNRVLHYQSIGRNLPPDVAVDNAGQMTTNPHESSALLPLGGLTYGYKGAALAGLCELFGCMLSGMAFSHQLIKFHGDDMHTRRHLGHFFMIMRPDAFIDISVYQEQMGTYLQDLREQKGASGCSVMAPGDREWKVQAERSSRGIPVDPALFENFNKFSGQFGVAELTSL